MVSAIRQSDCFNTREVMDDWQTNLTYLAIAALMVILNGFFVAAEFALVKVRAVNLKNLSSNASPLPRSRTGSATGWTHRCPPANLGSRWRHLPWDG